MPLPTISVSDDLNATILVPPQWTVVVTAVTRQCHNYLIACDWQDGQTDQTSFLANEEETPYVPLMNQSDKTSSELKFPPQDVESQLVVQTYYSLVQTVRGIPLRSSEDAQRSSQINVLEDEKYRSTTEEDRKHVRFTIAAKDTPLSGDPLRQFFDLVITVTCLWKDTKPSPFSSYNLANIQGDIAPGLPKTVEYFYYFNFHETTLFSKVFRKTILPKITTSLDLTSQRILPASDPDFLGLTLGLSDFGLIMWYRQSQLLRDESFDVGSYQDSLSLGDAGEFEGIFWLPDWDDEFLYGQADGVFVITAFDEKVADKFVKQIEDEFKVGYSRIAAIEKKLLLKCRHEDHFGYRGGISNPQIEGVTFGTEAQPRMQYPGSPIVPMGTIVTGYEGDEDIVERPDWARDGAFMVTRKLNTLVPEFEAFLLDEGQNIFPDLPPQDAADKLGARLFGRWKDGTPTELSPDEPDTSISGDDGRVNAFTFNQSSQKRCPFAAHIRKSNPRSDIPERDIDNINRHLVRRQGISFGPPVTQDERATNTTIYARGQHFVCYASSIVRRFKHLQCERFNNTLFPPLKRITPGYDPIVGQPGELHKGEPLFMTGADPDNESSVLIFPKQFVVARGGAYFFVPSLSTLAVRGFPRPDEMSLNSLLEKRRRERAGEGAARTPIGP